MVRRSSLVSMPKISLRTRSKTRTSWKAGRRCSTISSMARSRAFFFLRTGHRRRSLSLGPFEGQGESILEDPFDVLAISELAGMSECRGEVDVPLFAALAFDGLHLRRKSHV